MNMKSKILVFLLWLCSLNLFAERVDVPHLSLLPERVMSERVPLSGKWLFSPSPGDEFWKKKSVRNWKAIEVPGKWVMQGFEVEKGKAAGYFRAFTVPAAWQGKRVKLRCNGIYSDA